MNDYSLENVMESSTDGLTKCGFVALIGAPNAGKSTLMNAVVGTKVSIVTHKVQTTRAQVRAVATKDHSQVIFVDTPGIFAPRRRLDEAMVTSAWGGAGDADVVALLIDPRKGINEEVEDMLSTLNQSAKPIVLILNKVDVSEQAALLKLAATLNEKVKFAKTFMISALNGDGVADVLDYFCQTVPVGPWLYPEDHLTDLSLRMTASEITREKLFLRVHDEIPYSSTVETESFEERKDGSYRIEQIIYVQRDSQKKILLGAKGQTIKSIGSDARAEMCEIFETKVHLFLFVKVREKWIDDPERYREMGLQFPSAKNAAGKK